MNLNPIFSDGMILAANKPIYIFGEGGGIAQIEFCGKKFEKVFTSAKWVMELPKQNYGGPFEMKITLEHRERVIRDIYFGDVFFITGQSNMQFRLCDIKQPEEYETVDDMKLFSNMRTETGEAFMPEDGWVSATKENSQYFSAIGFMFAREYLKRTKHKIGLVTLYQGAADIQCFLPFQSFISHPEWNIPNSEKTDNFAEWNLTNSTLYDLVFNRITPFAFTGVVWYQGESNWFEKESLLYADMLEELIYVWRSELRDENLPFVVIQLHDFIPRRSESWSRIQQAQEEIQYKLKNVKTVYTKDVSENDLIHPLNKKPVALRVADAAIELIDSQK